jgi:hypothetical protein
MSRPAENSERKHTDAHAKSTGKHRKYITLIVEALPRDNKFIKLLCEGTQGSTQRGKQAHKV